MPKGVKSKSSWDLIHGVLKSSPRQLLTIPVQSTVCGHRFAHRKWKETKLQPGTGGPRNRLGCCFVSFHFLWAILCLQAVQTFLGYGDKRDVFDPPSHFVPTCQLSSWNLLIPLLHSEIEPLESQSQFLLQNT